MASKNSASFFGGLPYTQVKKFRGVIRSQVLTQHGQLM